MKNSRNILIVGSLNVVFIHSYAISLLERGFSVLIVDIGVQEVEHTYLLERGIRVVKWSSKSQAKQKIKSRIKKFIKMFGIDRKKYFIDLVNQSQSSKGSISNLNEDCRAIISDFSPANILYGWSTTVRPYKLILERFLSAEIPSSLLINTYPVRENFSESDPDQMTVADREFFSRFDAILQTSLPMSRLFLRMGYDNENAILHDDRLHPDYFRDTGTANTDSKLSDRSVIFLGNTDFDERSIDDVRRDLTRMLDAGIGVAIQRPKMGTVIDSRFTLFDPFTYEQMARGDLARFIGTFDFVYMGYNDMKNARTSVSFPTRFALAMTGNIPVLLERDNWAGLKAAVADVTKIVEFDSIDDCLEIIWCEQPSSGGVSLGAYRSTFDRNFEELMKKIGIQA